MLNFTDLLPFLDHTGFRSGEELAARFKVTRGTIHNCILRIESLGIPVERVPGRGYRLRGPLDLLNREDILEGLGEECSRHLDTFYCLNQIDSTNRYAGTLAPPTSGKFTVVVAEMQSAGKGRRGRDWVSPYAANIYLSIVWSMQRSLHEAGVLSPFLAVCLVEKLDELGLPRLGLKWPNDIYCDRKKLAGLLIECSGELGATCKMVIGLGLNVTMSQRENIQIDQQWTDICSQVSEWKLSRSALMAELIVCLINGVRVFEDGGITNLEDRWARWDIMRNTNVTVKNDQCDQMGIARGISSEGRLLLETKGQIESVSAGEITLRAQA